MLLEDSMRGAKVECLICRRMVEVDWSGSGERPTPPPEGSGPAVPPPPITRRQKIANCPNCSVPLRLPPGHEGRPIRCPQCRHVFTA